MTLTEFEDFMLTNIVNAMFVGDEEGAEQFLESLADAYLDESPPEWSAARYAITQCQASGDSLRQSPRLSQPQQ